MKPLIITLAVILSLAGMIVVYAEGRSLAEVLAENEFLRYNIALVEKEIDKGPPTESTQLTPGMVAVDITEYDALVAYQDEYYNPEVNSKLSRELINARMDLIIGRAKEFEVGSEKTSSGFPVSRIEEVRQLSSGLRHSVLLFTSSEEVSEGESTSGSATAFLIQPDLAVTNSHNIRDKQGSLRKDKIVLHTFQGKMVNASVVGDHPGADTALLRLERPLLIPVIKWGDIRNLSVGDPVFTIGHPARMGSWVTHVGILEHFESLEHVTGFEAGVNHEKLWFSAPTMKGGSGSPVFDMNGDVVGLLYGTEADVDITALPLQLHTSLRFLKKMQSTATASHQVSLLVAEFLAAEGVK